MHYTFSIVDLSNLRNVHKNISVQERRLIEYFRYGQWCFGKPCYLLLYEFEASVVYRISYNDSHGGYIKKHCLEKLYI